MTYPGPTRSPGAGTYDGFSAGVCGPVFGVEPEESESAAAATGSGVCSLVRYSSAGDAAPEIGRDVYA